jgi:chromosome partitioning protein
LFVDLDPQGNLSRTFEADMSRKTPDTLAILTGEATAAEAVQHTQGGDIIAASPALVGADREKALSGVGREYRLRSALESLRGNYDYCIVDTPPALGILTVNALTAADQVVIPAQADDYSLDAVERLSETIQAVRDFCNPSLQVGGILLTRYNGRNNVTRYLEELIAEAAERLGARVYVTRIRECAYLKEAKTMRQDIYSYSPRSNAAKDYRAFVDEFEGGTDIG